VVSLFAACAHAPAIRVDHSWMRESTVTAFKLAGYQVATESGQVTFHGLPIVRERALSIREQENLVNLLVAALERQKREEAEARKDVKITGGVWGCLSGSRGLRFQAAEVRRR